MKIEIEDFYEIVACEIEHEGELEEDIYEFLNVEIDIEGEDLLSYFRRIPVEAVLEWLGMYTDNWNTNSGIYKRVVEQLEGE